MKKYFLVLIGIAILLTSCSVFNSGDSLSPKAKRALRNGNIYFSQQLLERSEGFFNEVLEEYPNHLETNKKIADIKFFNAENNDRIAYQSYLEAFDKYQIVYDLLKDVDRQDMSRDERRWYKDTRKKIESVNARVLLLANKEYDTYMNEGIGNLDEIIAKYHKLISLDPDNIDPYRFLTSILNNEKNILLNSENPDEFKILNLDNDILNMFSQWVRIEPKNIEYRAQYARQLYVMERYTTAAEQFSILIQNDPYNYDHYDLYATTVEAQGDYQAAFDKMLLANNNIPENVNVLQALVFYSDKLENDEAYIEYSKQLIDLEASPENLKNFSYYLAKNEMFDNLLVYAEKWFVADRENRVPAQLAALAAQKLKNTNKYQYYAKKYQELTNAN